MARFAVGKPPHKGSRHVAGWREYPSGETNGLKLTTTMSEDYDKEEVIEENWETLSQMDAFNKAAGEEYHYCELLPGHDRYVEFATTVRFLPQALQNLTDEIRNTRWRITCGDFEDDEERHLKFRIDLETNHGIKQP